MSGEAMLAFPFPKSDNPEREQGRNQDPIYSRSACPWSRAAAAVNRGPEQLKPDVRLEWQRRARPALAVLEPTTETEMP